MVSSANMLLNTGTWSDGQPVPVKGWQFGEENGRVPTNVRPFGATEPKTVPPGMQFPPGPALYGSGSPVQVGAAVLNGCVRGVKVGITTGVPLLYVVGTKYGLSAPTGPHPDTWPVGSFAAICASSRHVCVFPGFRSCDASKWCACVPTYETRNSMSLVSCRSIVRLYCSAYCDFRWG